MATIEIENLAQQLSQTLIASLPRLLEDDSPPAGAPPQAQACWDWLRPHLVARPRTFTWLDQIANRHDDPRSAAVFAWMLERVLGALDEPELLELAQILPSDRSSLFTSLPTDPYLDSFSPEPSEEVYRSWEPESPVAPAPEPGAEPTLGAEPTAGAEPASSEPWLADGVGGGPGDEEAPGPPVELDTRLQRFLRSEVSEHDPSQPLPLEREFTLAFYVDLEAGTLGKDSVVLDETRVYQPGEQSVQLNVQLTSRDFIVHTRTPQELRLPRAGLSRNKARFDLEPRRAGVGEVTAVIYKDNNFIQGLTLRLNVANGEAAIGEVESLGRPVESASAVQQRDVMLFIKKAADGFDVTMVGAVAAQAFLPLTPQDLNDRIQQARQALAEIVHMKLPGRGRVYQEDIDIPTDAAQSSLAKLAEAGYLLFEGLFYGPGTRADAHQMGDKLRTLADQGMMKLQIISQEFFLPWGLLYLAEYYDPQELDHERFLGMRHIIEHIPLQANMQVLDHDIPSQPHLAVSMNIDARIDQAMDLDVIETQRRYWEDISRWGQVTLVERQTAAEFLEGMRSADNHDQILYFYGHAVSQDLQDRQGPQASSLRFSDQKTVTLRELNLQAPARRPFQGKPLVFINACESAELSPLFYGGFMPYFIEKGARGMIGAECEIPAKFAADWAQRFFERFLFDERPIGEIFLNLRREFYTQHHNILGLLYALYCDGDTRIRPGLALG